MKIVNPSFTFIEYPFMFFLLFVHGLHISLPQYPCKPLNFLVCILFVFCLESISNIESLYFSGCNFHVLGLHVIFYIYLTFKFVSGYILYCVSFNMCVFLKSVSVITP